jgi:single-strand DNA-binding protein
VAQDTNSVVLVGNLTRDPELRHTPSGTPVASLRVAVNDRVKKNGEWTDAPYYFDVTVWGSMGENCVQYLAKGKKVAVTGKLTWREWEAADGSKRQAVEIVANNVQFLSPRDSGGGDRSVLDTGYGDVDYSGGSGGSGSGTSTGGGDSAPAADDDIPF